MPITLEKPHVKYRDSFLAALKEMTTDSDRASWIYRDSVWSQERIEKDFAGFVNEMLTLETNPPSPLVPDSVYWVVENSKVVGRISLRHVLNDFLKKVGGHIGYIVRPSARGRGVATESLKLLLRQTHPKRIGRLLLTCDDDNVGSIKTIEKNGGKLMQTISIGEGKPLKRHYWIEAK